MIVSELSNSQAAMMRLLIAAITSIMLAPLALATMWCKPIAPAMLAMFLPAIVAGVICLYEFEPDYGYFKLAVPLIFAGCMVAAIAVPSLPQAKDANSCARCGYDLRGSPSPRCPECGWDRALPAPLKSHARARATACLLWLAAAAFSGAIIWLFFSWLLSLG
jgi:hypothetical protein